MDGLSQQSEEEQEAMRLQAQDEQQQSDELQSNILRYTKPKVNSHNAFRKGRQR